MAKLGYGAFLLAWMLLIFLFSSQRYESQNLRPWLDRHLTKFELERRLSGVEFPYGGHIVSIRELGVGGFAEFFIRKAAHLTEYAILGGLLFLLLRAVIRRRRLLLPAVLLLGLIFAATDEYHQSFVKDRTPLLQDVLLDGVGACAGILLAMAAVNIGRRRTAWRGDGLSPKERVG